MFPCLPNKLACFLFIFYSLDKIRARRSEDMAGEIGKWRFWNYEDRRRKDVALLGSPSRQKKKKETSYTPPPTHTPSQPTSSLNVQPIFPVKVVS